MLYYLYDTKHIVGYFLTPELFFFVYFILNDSVKEPMKHNIEYFWVCKLQAINLTHVTLGFYFNEDDDRKAVTQVNAVLNTQVKNIRLQ